MPANKLVCKFLVALPVALLFGLGSKARLDYDPFDFTAPTQRQNNEILAYKKYVADAEKVTSAPISASRRDEARSIAKEWIAAQQAGTLCALEPISYDDSTRDGIKSEILGQDVLLATYLNYIAQDEASQGLLAQAASDVTLSLRVAGICKYSDYNSVLISRMAQLRSLRLVARFFPQISGDLKNSVVAAMECSRPDREKFNKVASLHRILFVEYLHRMGIQPTEIESTRGFIADGVVIPWGSNSGGGSFLVSSKNDSVPDADEQATLAKTGETDMDNLINHIEASK